MVGNKENNKKANEGPNGSKVALKPREFGREITNATTATTSSGALHSKACSSVIVDPSAGAQISVTGANTASSSVI